jgi:rare lipoprotein A
VNGKELITYKAQASGAAEQKADELASKIEELVDKDSLDPNKLMPAKEGKRAGICIDRTTLVKFDIPESERKSGPFEQSLKIVNSIRNALGAPSLPGAFFKLGEMITGRKAEGSCFSGAASWYGGSFHGRRTSDGSRFDQDGLTAAHRSLPFGTKLLVMNRRTGNSCVVQVNDRGPFIGGRIIDLSRGAAKRLNMVSSGVALVDCLVLREQ